VTRIIAVANHKGGVAKTTTTYNLAGYYAAEGKRVLVCDLDPQASLTKLFGLNPKTVHPSLAELLVGIDTPPANAIHPTQIAGVHLIPANSELAHTEKRLITRMNRELILARILKPIAEGYDVVLLDCPPALDLLNTNGLAAADEVVVPLESSTLAYQALPEFLRTVEDIQREVNPSLTLRGIVLTKHQANTGHSQQVLATVRDQFPGKVFQAVIPLSVVAKDSAAASKPICSFDPRSPIAEAYKTSPRRYCTMPKRPNIAALLRKTFADAKDGPTAHPLRSILKDENEARILLLSIDAIEPNPDQPRKHFDPQALEDLTASVKEKGILQPIIARKKLGDPDRCIIIAGERRWRAAKAAGLTQIPALIRDPKDALEIAIIENLQRENLSALEEAEALSKLKTERGYTLDELGRIIGKSKQSVSEMLKVLELPSDIRAEIRASTNVRTIPKSQVLQIVRAGSPEKVRATWDALKRGEVRTVRDLRERKDSPTGRPKHYHFAYRSPDRTFTVSVTFSKSRATHGEVKEALDEVLQSLP
jgi:chromosome partitioning protein